MSYLEKHRWSVVSKWQHLYNHSLAEFPYFSPAMPGVNNTEKALDWILAVLYPNAKPAVANQAALPLVGNTINDYRVVQDDGDGKAASYRWEQREGELTPSWHKVMDMDWSTDSILASFLNITQDLYVVRNGRTDIDGAGAAVVGIFAGQTVYGGNLSNQNLTLKANSGDGSGPSTGFVQVDDNFRPAQDDLWDLSTPLFRFKNLYLSDTAVIDTLSIAAGLITDSSGAISFGNENLTTTGDFFAKDGTFTGVVNVNSDILIGVGSITSASGTLSFGNEDLITLGKVTHSQSVITGGGNAVTVNPNGSLISSLGVFNLNGSNLIGVAELVADHLLITDYITVDNLRLDGSTLSTIALNTNLILEPNGTGQIQLNKLTSTGFLFTSSANIQTTAAGIFGNLKLQANTLTSEDVNGKIILDPNGTGIIEFAANFAGQADASFSVGLPATRFTTAYLSQGISDGTNNIGMATLLSLRGIAFRDLAQTVPAQTGDGLFYDSVNNAWIASIPDTEIVHSSITGLTTGDAGHTQFAMLAGRAGGQSIQGGTAASESLVLESTAHATKGLIYIKDSLVPFLTAVFGASWTGVDLGTAALYYNNIYTKGEHIGFRFENVTVLPSSSGQNVGRVVYLTATNKAYIDTGAALKVLGIAKYNADTTWNGTDTLKTVTVSADIEDARNAIWQLKDNANSFEVMGVTIRAISATQVTLTTNVALPAGAYRLTGIE